MKLYILIKDPEFVGEGRTFTHFWNNKDENFWDTCKSEIVSKQDEEGTFHNVHIETEWNEIKDSEGNQKYASPLDFYLGENYPNYIWYPLDNVKIQRNSLDDMSLQMSTEEIDNFKNFFFKLVDGDNTMYYYCSDINSVSDPNNVRTSWTLTCELDLWASYWAQMHSLMKKFDTVDVDFAHKMADRFEFNYTEGVFTKGFWIDYIKQQYLCRTNKFTSDLYNLSNQSLKLEDWRFLNSEYTNRDDWDKIWKTWEDNKHCSAFVDCLANPQEPMQGVQISGSDKNKIQNISFIENNDFIDANYNSNGKYRYFVLRLGNNSLPTEKDNKHTVGIKTEKIIEKYLDDAGIEKSYTNYINGENICVLPFPKGKLETLYLYYLNSTNKGLTIGNGTVMGMPVNDIPPDILALAIRTFDNKNAITQTIGDKLSFRDVTKDGVAKHCPVSLSGLRLTSFSEWTSSTFIPTALVGQTNEWSKTWRVDADPKHYFYYVQNQTIEPDTNCYGMGPHKYETSMEIGQYWQWNEVEDPSTGFRWRLSDLWTTTQTVGLNNGKFCWLIFVGGTKGFEKNGFVKANWKVCCAEDNGGLLPGINTPIEVESLPTEGELNRWYHLKNEESTILHTYNRLNSYDCLPCMFTDFSHIPVCLAKKRGTNVLGWNTFFENTYKLLTNDTLTKKNIIESDPIFYSPGIYKWVYYIDGIHKIELTNDMLDLKKMITEENWTINLNTCMTTHTAYYLDLKDLLNKQYPLTKTGMEFMSEEYTSYPFTTEAYNDWLQTNQSYIETAKNAKDIDFKWRMKNNTLAGLLGIGESTISGIGSGMLSGAIGGAISGGPGAIGGAILGGLGGGTLGGMGILGRKIWTERAYQETMEQFNNQVRGMKSNLYSSPATMVNPSGFHSGSLVYSPSEKAIQNSYELFKLYEIPMIVKQEIWHDISWNGYQFASQCYYKEYNNRVNFNIIEANLNGKGYMVVNYLRTKMMELNPLFSQDDSVSAFMNRCSHIMRLFKCEFDIDNMEKVIEDNIELKREWVSPYDIALNFVK